MTRNARRGVLVCQRMEHEPLQPAVDFLDIALRLTAAVAAGALIGLDREWRGKPVGIRTLALVSLGSALVCLSTLHLSVLNNEPDATSRVVQGIIQGVMAGGRRVPRRGRGVASARKRRSPQPDEGRDSLGDSRARHRLRLGDLGDRSDRRDPHAGRARRASPFRQLDRAAR